MDVRASENVNGVRMSWNLLPVSLTTSKDSESGIVPVGCLYTPLKETSSLQLVEYEPVRCKACGAVLNPCCHIAFRNKSWTCPICSQVTVFPAHYAEHISETMLPAEAMCSTIEYILPQIVCAPPVFLLVLDIALIQEELDQAKDSLQQSLALMPQNALVGFMTFGSNCYIHVLETSQIPHCFAFRGTKEYDARQVARQVCGFTPGSPQSNNLRGTAPEKFLVPVAECEFMVMALLDDLARDDWPSTGGNQRPQRCIGSALSVALGLMETTHPQSSVRIMLVIGGPCNIGPGIVVGEELLETIRSHQDLQKERPNARYTKNAMKFYSGIATRAIACGFAVDIFACSLDQVGLHEMAVLVDKTGGSIVMGDSFSMSVFKDSFRKMFDCDDAGYLRVGFNACIDVLASSEIKCSNAIGGLSPADGSGNASVTAAGQNRWRVGALDKNTTIALYFEPLPSPSGKQNSYIQFQTAYCHPSGRKRLRVTTISNQFASMGNGGAIAGFDQEAAAVLTARLAVHEGWTQDTVDRRLIKLVSKFGDYRKNESQSFKLRPEMAMFPQFMYHLRRGNFLRTFGTSPDETAFYRSIILKENTLNSLVMIQPTLLQYSFDEGPPIPVALDASSLKSDVILLMDDFFHVVMWRGEKIQQWHASGLQEMEEYANFKALLQAPALDAKEILADRFPVPKFVQTSAGGSQARFVKAKVNPSNEGANHANSDAVITDDVSLKAFMENLIKLAVKG